ncbi:uncharacterized protein TRAVEDRAFT_71254 [Trametes versicolor FP-101664 SS1]|uniref:uncharacterized protein n=1 Tax=Trametes versicolor (strain FP-101664) TaxID=717944 RepID=UPI0004623E62|nr:uncharacterized protein TRAVEDRAFT_71254 [Trametes versicolor FP-101664 SS1]EIW59044.1 hypothetical protein TRAVEDRAFT_71254 [Trametes versicolor FP-101664 SS1]
MATESTTKVPGWLRTHPQLQKRGIVTLGDCLQPGAVWRTNVMEPPIWVVKIVEPGNQEAVIYQRLQRSPCRRNHTVPCDIIDSEGQKTILLMPQVRSLAAARLSRWPLSKVMDVFLQVVEGVEYLHEQRIAHMDICDGNTRMATDWEVKMDRRLAAERAYIIDFGTSRQLSLGPGVQTAMPLLYAQVPRPRDMDYFDPYSWDVYCLGKLLENMAQFVYRDSMSPPWIIRGVTKWLVGEERGCRQVCHCRPTARRARQVLTVLCWAVRASDWFTGVVTRAGNIFLRSST